MIVLVPVSRFRVEYTLAEGLPYSRLHRSVLHAVQEGVTNQEQLVNTFQIHPRLLIQSLVGLTHAGWIALGRTSHQQFVITPRGQQALTADKLPPTLKLIPRTTYVFLDRAAGTVIVDREAQLVSKWLLEQKGLWDAKLCLPIEVLGDRLDESEVHFLLPRTQQQRLYAVGRIELVSKTGSFMLVDVDLETGRTNLPPRIHPVLKPYVLDKATVLEKLRVKGDHILQRDELGELHKPGRPVTSDDGRGIAGHVVGINEIGVLTGDLEHAELLGQVFDSANSVIFIASASVLQPVLERLLPRIFGALQRGVDIHVLRGTLGDDQSLDLLKKISYQAKSTNLRGSIQFNASLAPSLVNLLMWDEPTGTFKAVVGSFRWLSAYEPSTPQMYYNASVWVTAAAMLSTLARCAATLWISSPTEFLASVPDRWRRIAVLLESRALDGDSAAQDESQGVRVRVIQSRNHGSVFRSLVDDAQVQLTIATPELRKSDLDLVMAAKKRYSREFEVKLVYSISDVSESDLAAIYQSLDVVTETGGRVPGLWANVVVSDDQAFITCGGRLSAPILQEPSSHQLGLLVDSAIVAREVANRLSALT